MRIRLDPVKVLAAGIAVRWFGISFYTPFILLYIHTELGVPLSVAGLYIALVALFALPIPILGGGLADRYGRRRVVLLSLMAEAGGIGWLALSMWLSTLLAVLFALFVVMVAGIIGSPANSAYIADSTEPTNRAKAFAWQRVGQNTGFTTGIALGGVLLSLFPYWQVAEYAAIVASAGAIFMFCFLPPAPHDRVLAGRRGQPSSDGGKTATASLRQRAASGFSVFWNPLRVLRADRSLLLFWIGSILVWLLVLQYTYAVPTFARMSLGVSYAIIGIALAINGIIPALTQVPMTHALTGRRLTTVGIWGIGSYAVAFLALGLLAVHPSVVVPALFAMVVVMTLGENLVSVAGTTIPMNLAPEEARGAYAGAVYFGGSIGSITAPILAGLALSWATQPLLTWIVLALPAIPATGIFLALQSRLSVSQNTV